VNADIEAYIRRAEEIRQPYYIYIATGLRVMRALLEGRFAEAERLALQALALGQRV
jgi:hypothetical protein